MAKRNEYFPQSVPHPGETLSEKLDELGMGPKEFAVRTGKPEKTITAILKGESSVTADMAVLFEDVLKIPAHFWLNNQRNYDEYLAREKRKAVIEEAVSWARLFPVADMVKKSWLTSGTTIQEKAAAMLSFFGFSSHAAWEDYYFKQQLKVAFRISLANTNEPYSISAWLRKGELQAAELEANPYDEKAFKEALPVLKTIMATHPANFFDQLQTICLSAGVKVVHTPCLPKAPINGSTRWLNDTPLIQLSCRYNRNDGFWFTFFHEAGHILLHGKKDIFLEKVEYSEKDKVKEQQADDFAVRWTLKEEEEEEIVAAAPLSEQDITSFATKFNTHPAIIIGRLQFKKLIPYSLGREFFEPVVFE
ncbi:HigA family addiction module antitoxin [Chitinophagaceae bacterium LB-8]|uniref:HigA family addiction module antitoxin n=1 Tax=Paraflavisolibacter caeni TaxID=2982496 RepID=A0A9X3BFP5_9BACT|nr:HigA family addiction module antitoxin [Paraflavisolibacter caeni]MCU7549324.1 HigA family addiction module antitoxin [Paraflavisolibacter caeni]